MVPGIGVEPTSYGFSDRRSDRLSYPGIISQQIPRQTHNLIFVYHWRTL